MGAFCGLTAPVPARFTDPAGGWFSGWWLCQSDGVDHGHCRRTYARLANSPTGLTPFGENFEAIAIGRETT
jgi:hypothetical protein